MMGLDAVVAIAGMIIPSAVDFIKKKFLKQEDNSPEATLANLATTTPDVIPAYLTAQTGYMDALVKTFNRDVTGTPSQWVIDLRAAIRPIGVVAAFAIIIVLAGLSFCSLQIDPSLTDTVNGIRISCELIVSSWFGDRITIGKH